MKKYRIGMRNIKTAIAVLLSLAVYIILLFIDDILGLNHFDWNSVSNMYTPFFAGIAAVYATHRDTNSSFKQAKIRSVGSIIGGYYGMVIILIVEHLVYNTLGINDIILSKSIIFVLVAAAIIPLILLTDILKQNTATFITCLTYLSVTISIRNGGMPIVQFATNRVLSTLIGVGLSLIVNNISLLRRRNTNIYFVSSLDNAILDSNENISKYLKYELNSLYYRGMRLIFATTRTLSSLSHIFEDVAATQPMIVMNGSAIYNFADNTYENVDDIDNNIRLLLDKKIEESFKNAFYYNINNNIMHCYHNELINEGEIDYFNKRQAGTNYSFVRGKVPQELHVALIVIIDKKENIEHFIEQLNNSTISDKIDIIVYPYEKEGYYYLKINSAKATKYSTLLNLNKTNEKIVVCGSGRTDIELMDKADFSICLSSAPDYVKEHADYIIKGNNPAEIFKLFEKIFYAKNPSKKIDALKHSKNNMKNTAK